MPCKRLGLTLPEFTGLYRFPMIDLQSIDFNARALHAVFGHSPMFDAFEPCVRSRRCRALTSAVERQVSCHRPGTRRVFERCSALVQPGLSGRRRPHLLHEDEPDGVEPRMYRGIRCRPQAQAPLKQHAGRPAQSCSTRRQKPHLRRIGRLFCTDRSSVSPPTIDAAYLPAS